MLCRTLLKESLDLLESAGEGEATREKLQLQWEVLAKYTWIVNLDANQHVFGNADWARIQALQKSLSNNPRVQRDPMSLYLTDIDRLNTMHGCIATFWNDGNVQTHDHMFEYMVVARDEWMPLLRQMPEGLVGARKEFYQCLSRIQMICGALFLYGHGESSVEICTHVPAPMTRSVRALVSQGTQKNAKFLHAFTAAEWGGTSSEAYVDAAKNQTFSRHHQVARNGIFQYK